MKGQRVHEYVVPFPATDVWGVVGSLELPHLLSNMPGVHRNLTVMGDGSVGTILIFLYIAGWPFKGFRERISTLDHANRVKDVDVIQGGVLNYGYTSCRTRFEVLDLDDKGGSTGTSSTLRTTVSFDIDENKAPQNAVEMVALMQMDAVGKAIAMYLVEKNSRPRKLAGEQSFDQELAFPAADVWNVYGTLKLPELFRKAIPDVQWQGNGSVGTTFSITLNPGRLPNYKERLVTLDQKQRIKELDVIEGGVRIRDFTFYRIRSRIVENGPNSTVVKNSIRYELNPTSPTAAENMKLANILIVRTAGELTSDYLKEQKKGA
ncbi:hypothetical protein H6P81_005355 [Aristolochia fimbriata]|uniref:Bet v I/Major latex protein domain-containing protein n=1 Tax=Aristolochia fimbriata TaxID=158543 RepID=A0AAV7EVC6_ARIFI|nr:hypothetical protein H6P81_005355 [Aristolochia fimbriata]